MPLRTNPRESILYQELQLWIFYIGALYEQRLPLGRVELAGNSLSDMLAIEASTPNNASWKSMKEVLQKFLFSEFLEPRGELQSKR
jgi:hypothetical protein